MKKKLLIMLAVMTALALSACSGSKEETTTPSEETEIQEEADPQEETTEKESTSDTAVMPSADLPLGEDLGTGKMYVATAGGTSEDGNIPKILIDPDTVLTQIGLNTEEFDVSHFSFVYINGVLFNMTQLGDSQDTIDLDGDLLKAGTYTLSVVQYEGDSEDGEILTYKEAKYEIVVK